MVAKSGSDIYWTDFDREVPRIAKPRRMLPNLFTSACSSFLFLARVGFYFIFSLLVLTGVIAATFNVPAALISSVGQGLGSFFEQISVLISFWTSAAILIGEMLWFLLTSQADLCFMRTLELVRMLNLH